jgi:hypothetical protein
MHMEDFHMQLVRPIPCSPMDPSFIWLSLTMRTLNEQATSFATYGYDWNAEMI